MSIDRGGPESDPQVATMFCLRCDYTLDGLRSTQCPECGREFDPSDLSTYRHVPQAIVLDDPVCLGQMAIEKAVTLLMQLESQNVAAAMHEERGGIIAEVELQRGSVWVERADEQRARAIMRQPMPTADRRPWTCAACGERIEGQFTMCWSCGAERG